MLEPKRYEIHKKRGVFELKEGPTHLVLSFTVDKVVKDIVKQLFEDNIIQWSSGKFKVMCMVKQVQVLPAPDFNDEMNFQAQTPISISVNSEQEKYAEYLHPSDDRYADAFALNLVNKANAYLQKDVYKLDDVTFNLLSENVRSKLWTIKGTSVKGYQYDFSVTAPPGLLEIGYYAGFGVQNSSLGMGYCGVK